MTDKPPLYDRLKAAGINMDWYDKHKPQGSPSKSSVPLNDDRCSVLSIYLLEPGGKLHTTTSDGQPYMLARVITTKVKQKRYLCASCGVQFKMYKEASEHYAN